MTDIAIDRTEPGGLLRLSIALTAEQADRLAASLGTTVAEHNQPNPADAVPDAVQSLMELISSQTFGLLKNLATQNKELKKALDELGQRQDKRQILVLLGAIVTQTNSIQETVQHGHDELQQTRQALEAMREEIRDTRRLLTVDPLTGLPNARSLPEALDREVDRSSGLRNSLCLAVIELDGFQELSAQHDQDLAGTLLQHVTKLLQPALRATDTLFRHEGGTLIALFQDTPMPGAHFVLERLKELLARTPFVYGGRSMELSVCAGLAQLRVGERGPDMVARARLALEGARAGGRGQLKLAE